MGGKKKSLANRLAKMSDEERARYLQHKADIEEEAKKRKEQLVAIFMKNKIKREDGFSRLNLAKINQQWHQILRMNKCKEMKEEVEHMKKYMNRILEYKDRTIKKLLEELEMAEEQYSHNFQTHASHIDQTIDSHEKYMTLMEEQYQSDLDNLLESSTTELTELLETSRAQQNHLKTIIFGENTKSKEIAKANKERYLKKKEDVTSTFRLKLDSYIKHRENHCGALWRQIAAVIKSHVAQTDARRLHLAELKRLDAESAAEIASNQERITLQEEEIKSLNRSFHILTNKRSETMQNLNKKLENESSRFLSVRQHFRKKSGREEKLIVVLTDQSNKVIEYLQKLKSKGEQIVTLMMTCRKFETEREQLTRWIRVEDTEITIDEEEREEMKRRMSAKSDSGTEEVKKVVISVKASQDSLGKEDIVSREFALLANMDKFWEVYSKVDVEVKEMKLEKKVLQEQNKHYRGMIRAVLEAVALDQTTPSSKVPTRVASKSRGAVSAPLRRILV